MWIVNGWTGAHYSLYRCGLGAYLFVHFAMLLPWGEELFSNAGMVPDAEVSPLFPLFPNPLFVWDAPALVTGAIALGCAASAALAIGWRDRGAALGLWFLWACLFTRNPLIANPSLPFIGWLLLVHAVVPSRPYGAWHSRGEPDPGAHWRMPPALFAAGWILMALAYTYSGAAKLGSPSWIDGTALARVLENPLARPTVLRDLVLALPEPLLRAATWTGLGLELFFAPLALFRVLRPWLWLALLAMHLALILLIDFADLSLGMVVLHAFTCDPGWIAPARATGRARVYYDGACGLCHRTLRFLLAEDRTDAFRYAPLDSDAFRTAVAPSQREKLPDAIVVLTPQGEILTRSAALLYCGSRLGGAWRLAANLLGWLPMGLRDRVYDAIAAHRRRWFATPQDACPLVPEPLRKRFEI